MDYLFLFDEVNYVGKQSEKSVACCSNGGVGGGQKNDC